MSEAELHFIQARLLGGELSKARRGELACRCPSGWSTTRRPVTLDPEPLCNRRSGTCSPFRSHRLGTACVKQFPPAGLLFPGGISGPHG